MKTAHEISADDVVTVPAQRIDTLVTDPSRGQQRHRTEPGAAGEIQIQAGAAIQGSRATSAGGNFTILEVAAALGQDPANSGALLLYLAVKAIATLPLGVAYRAVVVSAPEAVRPPAA